jgi:8-oxo-dGTP pyrophosphatase MutT (NUDIX family)
MKGMNNPARRESGIWMPMQVAAVCYRVSRNSLEFLLVNTSSGKWTFPKGHTDPDLSGSEAAAREAMEEAGVKGTIEESYFDCYLDCKRGCGNESGPREILIAAYLLEVAQTGLPEELYRNPSWFAPLEARQRLAERRERKYGQEMARIVEGAVDLVIGSDARAVTLYASRYGRSAV